MRSFNPLLPLLLSLIIRSNAQDDLRSPCPRLFVYEAKSWEPDRWYGIITLLTDDDFSGVWLRVILDREAIQLGNWFGKVTTTDNKEYLVAKRDFNFKAHTPVVVRFFVEYNPAGPVPRLRGFRLNAKTICPEQLGQRSTTEAGELQTSGPIGTTTPQSTTVLSTFIEHLKVDDNKKLEDVCGTVVAQPRPLIAYGTPANEGEFPWHVALYQNTGVAVEYVCGGSLISRNHVVTAAHCITITSITHRRSRVTLNPSTLVIYLGKFFLRSFTNLGIQVRQASQIVRHEQYNSTTYKNDIALIKLTKPVQFTDYVRPICLWQESTDLEAIAYEEGNHVAGTVVGWGYDENGKLTEQLMRAQMPVVTQESCWFSFPEFYSRFTSSNTYCAGFRNGTSVCTGDSGGGMVFPRQNARNKTVWHLRGLMSIGVMLHNELKCEASQYIVFTDLAKYIDWIKNIIV